jgi:hypothetical protein
MRLDATDGLPITSWPSKGLQYQELGTSAWLVATGDVSPSRRVADGGRPESEREDDPSPPRNLPDRGRRCDRPGR